MRTLIRSRLHSLAVVFIATSALGIPAGHAAPPAETLVGSWDDTVLPADDKASLVREALAAGGSTPWLIRIGRELPFGPSRRCEVYLPPKVQGERLRRGDCLRGGAPGRLSEKKPWVLGLHPTTYAYAQVAMPGKCFGAKMERPGTLDAPFEVRGTLSDQDLVDIVDRVRTDQPNAAQEPGHFSMMKGANGEDIEVPPLPALDAHKAPNHKLPIQRLDAADADHVRIKTSSVQGIGEDIEVRRENGRWVVGPIRAANGGLR